MMQNLDFKYDCLEGSNQQARRAETFEELERDVRSEDWELLEIEQRLSDLLGLKRGEYPRFGAEKADIASVMARVLGGDYRILAAARSLVWVDRLPIPRGKIDLYGVLPRLSKEMAPTLYYTVVSLPDGESILRENHDNKGYHYHYSDNGTRRADVLLTFSRDARAAVNPVTWERHAANKADFQARVSQWKKKRRLAVNSVCKADAAKRGLENYVMPGAGAQLIIPF